MARHRHEARIVWQRSGAAFLDKRYSRAHQWSFDGGLSVPASSSPHVVPVPYSVAEAVDPEEALVAAASSCHMLSFLAIAAQRRFVVESYVDDAWATMAKNAEGKLAITTITLRPRIEFSGERAPSSDELDAMHHLAHEQCYIASSLRSEIVVTTPNEDR